MVSKPKQFLKIFRSEKMRWKQGWQLKSCLHLVYFHAYSFATVLLARQTCPRISSLVMFHSEILQKEMPSEKPLLK